MLTFESPFYEIEGVVIFRDHAVPTLFHYLAGPPRLTRENGKPNMLLLKYKHALDADGGASPVLREQLGGGFLMFGVDCGLSEDTKSTIKQELESRARPGSGPISLVPVLYTEGKVNVIALDQQTASVTEEDSASEEKSKFVRGIIGTAKPSLLQDQRAIFSLSLTPDAATLLEEAYDSELSPIGVMYELEFSGLRPALQVKAKVDKKRVYEQFKVGLHVGVSLDGERDDATLDRERDDATLDRERDDATLDGEEDDATLDDEEDDEEDEEEDEEDEEDDATTAPAGAQSAATSNAGGAQVAISADLSYTLEKLKETGAIEIEILRQQEGQSVEQMEQRAMTLLKESLLKEFFNPAMSNRTSPSANAAAAVTAARNMMASSSDTNRGQSGGGAPIEIGFQLKYKKEEQLKTATFDYSVTAPETRTHAPNGFFSALIGETEKANHIREIDLDDDFFKIIDVDISTTADFELLDLKKVVIDLQYGGTVDSPHVTSTPTFEPTDIAIKHFQASRDVDDLSYRYKYEYLFGQAENIAAQNSAYETEWLTTTSRALVVHPPEQISMLHVYIEPGVVDWEIVDKIETRMIYEDADNNFNTERTYLINQGAQRQEWIIRLTNPELKSYKVQHTWHLKDRREIVGQISDEIVSHLFVGDPFVDRLLILIRPVVDRTNVARIDVQIDYHDEGNDHNVKKMVELAGPDFRPENVTIPILDDEQREYSYKVSLVKVNGQTEDQIPQTTDQLSINVTEGGIYLDVNVVLLGNMTQLLVSAVQIDLRSEPLSGETQKIESHLFMPDEVTRVEKRLLLRADIPQQFEYRTTVFKLDGGMLESEWIANTNKILPIQLVRLLAQ